LEDSESWNPGDDNVRAGFVLPSIPGFRDKASALSGSKSNGKGVGIAITAGPINPLDPKLQEKLTTKNNSAGVSFNFASSKNNGKLQMIDINGDGLPDKVFKDGGLYYRPNQSGPDGSTAFGAPRQITGVSNFSKGKSTTFDFGIESHFGTFAGAQFSTTKSKTTVYFADPTFTASSDPTPSPIISGSNLDPDLVTVDPNELEEAIDQNPLHDVVRVWEAPYDGTIGITNDVQLIESTDEDRAGHPADGVRVAIQHEDVFNMKMLNCGFLRLMRLIIPRKPRRV